MEAYALKLENELVLSQAHLCHTCKREFPTCKNEKIIFGNGLGNDNVVYCDGYEEHEKAYYFKSEIVAAAEKSKAIEDINSLQGKSSICHICEFADMVRCCHDEQCGDKHKFFKWRGTNKGCDA